MRVARRLAGSVVTALALSIAAVAYAQKEPERTGGPYVPTPQVVVDQMLRFANVGPDDYVIDLGSGDGVIVLTAAREHKARGMGVDIDPELVQLANREAARLGIADRATFKVMDVFKADLSRATVVTLYLLPGMMINLRPKIYLELKPGTRVVSHDYHFEDWRPDDSVTFDVPEKEKINGTPRATIYLWIVPARVGGRWNVAVESGEQYEITWRQSYQMLDGTAQSAGRTLKVHDADLKGEQIGWVLAPRGGRYLFTGRVNGDAMQGTVDLGRGKTARWTAVRVGAKQASVQ